jgi:alcohol dehydrogenase
VVKIDSDSPWDEAALFGCAVITGAGAVMNTAKVELGAKMAVVGLGGVGFSAVLAVIDLLDSKLELAFLGAAYCINASDPEAIQKVNDFTNGGVDYAFEMAGGVCALELAYRVTGRGGTTVTASLPNTSAKWELQAVSLNAEGHTVKGCCVGLADFL